jgi:hypothetical protein
MARRLFVVRVIQVLAALVLLVIALPASAFADDWLVTKLRGEVLQLVGDDWAPLVRGDVVPVDPAAAAKGIITAGAHAGGVRAGVNAGGAGVGAGVDGHGANVTVELPGVAGVHGNAGGNGVGATVTTGGTTAGVSVGGGEGANVTIGGTSVKVGLGGLL